MMNDAITSVDVTDIPAGALLVDVRESDEWDAGHAPNAQHLPASELLARYGELPEDGPVYLVCRSGGRSSKAAIWLNQNGYEAINVRGGMGAWAEAGLPLTSQGAEEPFIL
ncbi:rhodanese-like domain-containing protein [Devriesea agamarum]|uniref:rhodanese-like domain-containing protein n=1 Tax=Devriesea agamarum TaxID=472569 RepID=UPI00071D286A|nr:rhodanese-like domain-containing protein [Devriesea agamarum]